jgi:hypothetical protein
MKVIFHDVADEYEDSIQIGIYSFKEANGITSCMLGYTHVAVAFEYLTVETRYFNCYCL